MPHELQRPKPNPEAIYKPIFEELASQPIQATIQETDKALAKSEANSFEELKKDRYSSDTSDRQWLAIWTAIVVTIWLMAVIGILLCNYNKFHLSETVLTALLATTTLNVPGLSYIVLRGHFRTTDKL